MAVICGPFTPSPARYFFAEIGPALSEREVVLLGAALVAVALDPDLQLRMRGEHVRHVAQLLLRLLGEDGGVELEEQADVPELLEGLVEIGLTLRVVLLRGRHRLRFGLGLLLLRLLLRCACVWLGLVACAGEKARETQGEQMSADLRQLHETSEKCLENRRHLQRMPGRTHFVQAQFAPKLI